MRPNPTNFVGYGTCSQTALLQRNFNISPSDHTFTEEVRPDRTFHIPQSLWDLDASIYLLYVDLGLLYENSTPLFMYPEQKIETEVSYPLITLISQ